MGYHFYIKNLNINSMSGNSSVTFGESSFSGSTYKDNSQGTNMSIGASSSVHSKMENNQEISKNEKKSENESEKQNIEDETSALTGIYP